VARAVVLGVADVLSKPVTPAALRRAVAAAVAWRDSGGPCRELVGRARRALLRRDHAEARALLRRAIDLNPRSREAYTLMGVLHDELGEHHTAYHAYKAALTLHRGYGPALHLLRGYCERFGLDPGDPRINPAAGP
jgi:tetratricopeptide (TPR) repeat protein